jgi:hypothetical protein
MARNRRIDARSRASTSAGLRGSLLFVILRWGAASLPRYDGDRLGLELVLADVPFDALVTASIASIAAKIVAQVIYAS